MGVRREGQGVWHLPHPPELFFWETRLENIN